MSSESVNAREGLENVFRQVRWTVESNLYHGSADLFAALDGKANTMMAGSISADVSDLADSRPLSSIDCVIRACIDRGIC